MKYISKSYRPEVRGYVIYFPRALREGYKSYNHELERPINDPYFYIGKDSSRDAKIY